MEEEQKINKAKIIKLSWLVLDLMGRGLIVSKRKIAEESKNNHVMSFLIGKAKKMDCDVFFYDEDISWLNDFISLQLSNLRLDSDENARNCHIYDKDTQGLNTLLIMALTVIYNFL